MTNNKFIAFMSILSVLLLLTSIFLTLQNRQLRKQIASLQTTASPIPSLIPAADNEVLGLQINTCCSCPTKIPLSLIGTDGWVVYEKGKDYAEYLPKECGLVVCQPCPPLEEENQRIECQDPRPEVCTMECVETPPYICGSDGKSYCTVCQACSNSTVKWYVLQNEPCSVTALPN